MTDLRSVPEGRHDDLAHRPWVGLVLAGAVGAVLTVGLLTLPREHAQLPAIAHQAMTVALPQWHTTEPVSEVVYGTRGADTFGETFLLLAAVVSVVLLTRRKEARRGFIGETVAGRQEQQKQDPSAAGDAEEASARAAEAEEADEDGGDYLATPDAVPVGTIDLERAEAMTVVVRTATRVAAPVLAVAGIYLVAEGYSPGGGFPAGGVALGVILMMYAGFGYARIAHVVRPAVFEVVELVGAFAIIVIEVLGLVFKGSFSANWVHLAPQETLRSGGVLQLFSVSEFFEVGTGLSIVVFALLGMRHDWAPDDEEDEQPAPRGAAS
jgi:multicomponent Na+:H+ antiporter subunit B